MTVDPCELSCCNRYDPETNRWTYVAPMSVARLGAGVATCGGALYVVGGFDGVNRWNTVERYHPDTNTWQQVSPMHSMRSGLGECDCNDCSALTTVARGSGINPTSLPDVLTRMPSCHVKGRFLILLMSCTQESQLF